MNALSILSFRKLLVAAALTLAAIPAASAQNASESVRVNVPFAFEVGSAHFAPGEYTIQMPVNYLLQVHGNSHGAFAMTQRETDGKPSDSNKIVFHRYGDRYFMAEILTGGSSTHVQFIESSEEKKVRKTELALNKTGSKGVELAMVEAAR